MFISLEHWFVLLSALLLFYELWKFVLQRAKDRVMFSWQLVERWTDNLYGQLQRAHVIPDLIVGIGRGGAIVAGMVSTKYRDDENHRGKLVQIAAIDRVYIGKEIIIVGLHNLDVHGKRVLLLNAGSFTGQTLDRARQLLGYAEPAELQTASLVIFADKSDPIEPSPDFVGAHLPTRKKTKLMPWRRSEHREPIASLPGPRTLVVLNGLVATGKTSVTDSLVKRLGFYAVYSDWYWFTYGLHDRATNPRTNHQHYEYMISLCWSALAMGNNVVLDTTSRWRDERDQIQKQADRYGIRVIFVHCHCSEDVAMNRIRDRKYIRPYDFGTESEYHRIKREYQEIDGQEINYHNVIDLNTETLSGRITNILSTADRADVEQKMSEVLNAIQAHYFARATVTDVPAIKRDPAPPACDC
jgi:hypoxanthine phosphoribosyltransferase/predicted kinase